MTDYSHPAAAKPAPANPLAVLPPTKQPRLYTLAEYLRREARTIHKNEYYNGKIVPMASAKFSHNLIAMNIGSALNAAIDKANKDLLVVGSDQKVYFEEQNVCVYADVLVVCERLEFYDDGQMLLTNPIMVVEVLSRSTRKFDQSGKFDLYKTLPSFREYVLVEQNAVRVETRFREQPNLWRETQITDPAAEVWFQSLGLSVAVKDIYKRVPGILA
ncbi:MAG: Uma2 family endonuclease [Saprospiraceae bacterium]